MEQNENTLDKLIESLRNDSPRLENPELMADRIMLHIKRADRQEAFLGMLRRLSVAASIIAIIGFAWLQLTATVPPKTDPAILAYQERTVGERPSRAEKGNHIRYIQDKLHGQNAYSILKRKAYENHH